MADEESRNPRPHQRPNLADDARDVPKPAGDGADPAEHRSLVQAELVHYRVREERHAERGGEGDADEDERGAEDDVGRGEDVDGREDA